MKARYFLFVIVVGLFLASCEEKTEDPLRFYWEYYPVELGSESFYHVDSIAYDGFSGNVDTFVFNLRERIDTTYIDDEERPVFGYSVYKQVNDSSAWIAQKTGVITVLADRIEKVEENRTFIKLVFPVLEDKRWLGNIPNGEPGELKYNYEYRQLHLPRTVENINYDSTLQVFHYNESNPFFARSSQERYALGIGLIYKELKELNLQGITDGHHTFITRYEP